MQQIKNTTYLGFLKTDSDNVKKWSSSESELNTVELSRDSFRAATTLYEKMQYLFNHAVILTLVHHIAVNYVPFLERYNLLSMAGLPVIVQRVAGIFATIYVTRKIVQAGLISLTYTSTFTSVIENQTPLRVRETKRLKKMGHIVKRVTIKKSNVEYDAYIIGYKDTINSGKWTLHSLPAGTTAEEALSNANVLSASFLTNCLIINGPMVNSSTGMPTRWAMSAGLEAGLQYLEKKIKAKNIVLYGSSLGDLQLSEAVMKHDFSYAKNNNVKYLYISDRSCISMTKRIGAMTFGFIEKFMKLMGAELDSMPTAEKLIDLKIEHIVIQNKKGKRSDPDSDDVVPNKVGLNRALIKKKLTKNKIFLEGLNISNHDPLITLSFYERVQDTVWSFFPSKIKKNSGN